MNPTTAALVAALEAAIRFVEGAYGPNTGLADRTTAPWRAAIVAATAPEEGADPLPTVKFHLDQAVDLAAKGWNHALAVVNLTGVDVGDVLASGQVDALIANWKLTVRRRRRAKRL